MINNIIGIGVDRASGRGLQGLLVLSAQSACEVILQSSVVESSHVLAHWEERPHTTSILSLLSIRHYQDTKPPPRLVASLANCSNQIISIRHNHRQQHMLHMYTGSAGLAARLPKGTSFLVAPVNCAKRRHESRLVPKATATHTSTILVSEATELHFRAAVEQLQHAKPTVSVDGAQAVHEDKGMTARFLQSVFGEKHTSKPARLKAVLAVFTATWW